MDKPMRVRKPAVAGSFYPGQPQTLRRDIESFLTNVHTASRSGRPLALIEPHAGYIYSGGVAAYGYRLIKDLDIRTVAVVSPSHMEYFPFVSVYDGDAYETPLGRIDVDKETARAIVSSETERIRLSGRGHINPGSHRQEHALEVQLPFLQTVLHNFRIVPIVMGDQDWELCSALGNALAPHMGRSDFLVVVSSDLSHFHGYETANKLDSFFCGLIEEMNPEHLYEAIRSAECEACGAGPVIASLIAARRTKGAACRILHAANSGDVTGDRHSVVGYAAAVIESVATNETESVDENARTAELTSNERSYLLDLARSAVAVAAGARVDPPGDTSTPALLEPRGAFVTLKIRGRLRGCIGMVESRKPLKTTVKEMARAAAISDPRFSPLDADELGGLDLEISVLSPLRRVRSPEEIVIGTHGLVVEKGLSRGLLLPQVATEAGWDVETFLQYTCEKAGLPSSAWTDPETKIYVFTAVVFGDGRRKSPPSATGD
jgi:AmmeMemoRadiSam system protein B/AmmeMemoRadiSam system protein A